MRLRNGSEIFWLGLLLSWISLPEAGHAFIVNPPTSPFLLRAVSSTCLDMAKKRGGLGSLVDAEDLPTKKSRAGLKKRSKRKSASASAAAPKKKAAPASSTTISPSLQEWISKQDGDVEAEDHDDGGEETAASAATSAATFEPFQEEKSKKRPAKKSSKKAQEEEQKTLILNLVEQLEEVLTESTENNKKQTDIQDILGPIRQLMQVPNANTNLRQLIAGNKRVDYRLAWVGSDDAICHVGTGLHTVPLARLQEVFLSCIGKSRLEVLEVIRIIGPFPNVRNTLEGSMKIGKRNLAYSAENEEEKTVSELAITYDTMVDGTGKQITAGMVDNVRKVGLHIAFADENAIVAVVPPENGDVRLDPLEDNGANILFFVKEDLLDEKLEALRVG
jgi:hypothetical protein